MENLGEGESYILLLKSEMRALKTFILEQIYIIKKNFEDSNNQVSNQAKETPFMSFLKEELLFLKDENKTKNLMLETLLDNSKYTIATNQLRLKIKL